VEGQHLSLARSATLAQQARGEDGRLGPALQTQLRTELEWLKAEATGIAADASFSA